jgi:SPP1 gp7 family putative phage head morphogenesis protein
VRRLPGERTYERELIARVNALRGLLDPAVAQILRTTARPDERMLSAVLGSVSATFARIQPPDSIPLVDTGAPTVANALRVADREMRVAAARAERARADALPGARFRFASPTGFSAPRKTTAYDLRLAQWAAENARLISQSIDQQYAADVAKAVADAVAAGKSADDIALILRERYSVRISRARLIASDQIIKLNAKIIEDRQREGGVRYYRWRTRGDDRVRPEHAAREGRIFAWDSPPPGGHPGTEVNCRCHAEPVYGEVGETRLAA